DAQGDTKNRSAEIQRCSGLTMEVISGDVNSTTFQQVSGEGYIGNVSVTWFYKSSDPIQNETRIDSNREAVRVAHKMGATGNGPRVLDEIRIQPTNCEGAPPTTYP
ncbi:MAG: hypothetical protein ABEI58_01475, partial [Candidatus Nanohaloarchaea archaeon]